MHRPVGDTGHIAVDLDFDTVEAATAFRDFLDFLTTFVWGSPTNAPALAGTPKTSRLQTVATILGGTPGPRLDNV